MALARIITRSQACSRQLALDLLARGYAVEIVSPDNIPDNIADLELRVDTAPGDQLIASVEAHNGDRSASLDFVHHLKAPMVDFMRRSPEPLEAVYFPAEPVSFNAEQSSEVEDIELPASALQLVPEAVSAVPDALPSPEAHTGEDEVYIKDESLTAPHDTFPALEMALPIPIAEEYSAHDSIIDQPPQRPEIVQSLDVQSLDAQAIEVQSKEVHPKDVQPIDVRPSMVQPERKPQARNRSARSFKRDALIFASVMLLALVLGYGIRRSGSDTTKPSAQNSGAVQSGNPETVAAASTSVNLVPAGSSVNAAVEDAARPAPELPQPLAIDSGVNSSQPPQQPQAMKPPAVVARTSIASKPARIPHKHDGDLVARDTVTYLDKSFKPAPKPKSTKTLAHRKPGSHKHGGIVAANSVTYLNHSPAPKTTKQNSTATPSNIN
jgi:hypothetical protein